MMLQYEIPRRATILAIIPLVALSLSQCATQEVERELTQSVERKGLSYARELAAQSPFKKIELSWREASELMKDRNPKYRQAILDKEESQIKKGPINNLTHEVRRSLSNSVQTTLNPSELARAMKDPVAALPKQLESITDLKNISHSLTQSEWDRVSQSVTADTAQRREMVNLHVLFCQSENLQQAEQSLQRMKEHLSADVSVGENKTMVTELAKTKEMISKERNQWLDQVRDFFNAEYYDVEFSEYKKKLSFYRGVNDPGFSDWKRWRMLENSGRLATELQKQHGASKPALPILNRITQNLGVAELRDNLAQQSILNEDMAKEVREMLKNWRDLKSVQEKISESKVNLSDAIAEGVPSVASLKNVTVVYQLKKKEIERLKLFWMIDEECWKS